MFTKIIITYPDGSKIIRNKNELNYKCNRYFYGLKRNFTRPILFQVFGKDFTEDDLLHIRSEFSFVIDPLKGLITINGEFI